MVGSTDVSLLDPLTDVIPVFKFFSTFVTMLRASTPASILGTRFAMSIVPFWTPEQFSERSVFPKN